MLRASVKVLNISLPTAARQHFLKHGYAIVPNAIDPITTLRLREAVLESTLARWQVFANWPTLDTVLKMESKYTDPVYQITMEQITKRRRLLSYYREMKRQRRHVLKQTRMLLKGRKREELSGEELWKLSELLAAAAPMIRGKGCTATVRNDPEMRRAIDQHAVNAWMTHRELQNIIHDDDDKIYFKEPLSSLASFVGGVEKPVIFADAPLLRETFGNPVAYHCTAPTFGVHTNSQSPTSNAVTILIFTYTPTSTKLEPFILANSHRFVREQLLHTVPMRRLLLDFKPLRTHIPSQLKQFQFDNTVVARSLLETEQFERERELEPITESKPTEMCLNTAISTSNDINTISDDNGHEQENTKQNLEENMKTKLSKRRRKRESLQEASKHLNNAAPNQSSRIELGTVMIIDPHLMMGFGPNFSKENEVVYRLNIVSENAKAFMRSNSWIGTWRMTPREVNFASPVVFPPLYK